MPSKPYTFLCAALSLLVFLGNLTYQKFVILSLPVGSIELSAGALLYPLSFLITDLVTECYGKREAKSCIHLALIANLGAMVVLMVMDDLPATSWSTLNDATFHQVFGVFPLAFIASTTALYVSQRVDVACYVFITRLTGPGYLWIRSNASTLLSLLVDTTLIVSFMTLIGKVPPEKAKSLTLMSYGWKAFFTVANTPLFYLCVHLMKRTNQPTPSNLSRS